MTDISSATRMKHIYLDYAAATPLDPRVKEAMAPWWDEDFGNASSMHPWGVRAKAALEDARARIAQILGALPEEIIFTSGGTEAANLALSGVMRAHKSGHLALSAIEHDAVLETARALEKEGFLLTILPVRVDGILDPLTVRNALRSDTKLVAVMYANNEIGVIEPIAEIAKEIRRWKRANGRGEQDPPYLCVDACQAPGALPIDKKRLSAELIFLNGSKIYGPKGVGCFVVTKGIPVTPIIFGGGQESGIRSGTENIPAIVGFARALELAEEKRDTESLRLTKLREYFFDELVQAIPDIRINGSRTDRLPNNVHISIPGVEGDALVIYLAERGVAASTGSACSSIDLEPSHVLKAIGCPDEYLRGSIRFTLGRETTKEDIDGALQTLRAVLSILGGPRKEKVPLRGYLRKREKQKSARALR